MRSMKKIMSLLLSLMLVATAFCVPMTASAWEARTNEVDLRLGFLNDTHITKTGSGEALALQAMQTLKTLGAEKLAFVGDNVYYNSANDDPTTDIEGYNKLYNAVAAAGYAKEDIIAYAMGNHEFPQANIDETVSNNSIQVFEEQSGFSLNHTATYQGFHFIAGGAKNYNGIVTAETEQYLKTEIDKALAEDSTNDVDGAFADGVIPDSVKPVFLLLHHPIGNTVSGTNYKYSAEFRAFLDARPQVVNITAHMHLLAQHPETIWQDTFTAFQSPMTAGGYQSQKGCVEEGNITDQMCSQGSFMEVKDNVVYLYRIDYNNGTYIGEPFVVDIPAIVADRLDDNPDNDKDSMLYTAEKRAQVTTTAEFPADAELVASVKQNNAVVTFPNTAYIVGADEIQQDNFLRAYKVEAVDNAGNVYSSACYQADFWKTPENRAESYTKNITGLSYGTEYTINVYPMTPFGSFGTPLSATIETEGLAEDPNRIRYEVEDYCNIPKLVTSSPNVSNDKFVISAQIKPYSCLTLADMTVVTPPVIDEETGDTITEETTTITNPYVIEFPINLPVDDTYKIEYVVNQHGKAGDFVSNVVIKIDGEEIGTNDNSYDIDLSLGNTFPWKDNMPLAHYTAKSQILTAGEHIVTIEAYRPTQDVVQEDGTVVPQPFLFCADYVQFTPTKLMLKAGSFDRAEFEDYILDFPYTLNDGSTYMPKVSNGELASGGKFAELDTDDNMADGDYEMRIPVTVENAGAYDMEYVALPTVSQIDVYLDSTDGEVLNGNMVKTVLDEKNADGKYPVFSSTWAQAVKFTKTVELPEGNHELIFVIHPREGANDIAQFLDYIQFTSLTKEISAKSRTLLEMEDYANMFYMDDAEKTAKVPDVKFSANASGASYIHFDTSHFENHPPICADIPVVVKADGKYEFEYIASNVGSKIYFYLDGLQINETYVEEILETEKNAEGKYDYFGDEHHAARIFQFSSEMTAGEHTLTLALQPRPEQGVLDVAGCVDYVEITPEGLRKIAADTATKIEFEDISTGGISNVSVASAGKITYEGFATKRPTIQTNVVVEESGYYDISYIIDERSVTVDEEANINRTSLSLITITLGDLVIGDNDSADYAKILPQYKVFPYAPMALYEKKSVWLEAGEYLLNAQVDVTPDNGGRYKYLLDCITFAPAGYVEEVPEDSIVIEEGVATATVSYDTYVAGTVVLAFYDAGQLVSMGTAPATGTKTVTVSAPVTGYPTNAKVFVWESFDGGKPVVAEKELDFLN